MNINGNGIKNKNQERWLSFSFWCNIYKVFYFFNYQKKKKNSQNSIKFPNSSKIEVCHNNNFKSIIKSTKEKKNSTKVRISILFSVFLVTKQKNY